MTTSLEVLTLPYDHHSQHTECTQLVELQAMCEVIDQVSYLVGPPEGQALVLVLTVRHPRSARKPQTARHTITRVPAMNTATVEPSDESSKRSARRARKERLEAALAALSDDEQNAFEALRAWRNAEGIRVGVPAFEVCSNSILIECITRKPHTLTALRAIKGLGERRVKRFGEGLLAQLRVLGLIAESES